jgi:hypothetical protein
MERLRPDDVVAIDVHVHAELSADGHDDLPPDFREAVNAYFRGDPPLMDAAGVADYYRERRMRAVVFSVDAELTFGHPRIPNEEIAEAAAEHDDVLIPFGSIDPHRGEEGVAEARRLVADHGVRGFKFHPSMQRFDPNDRLAYPLYEVIAEAGAVALFHTGHTGIGAGMPGGGGIRLSHSNPMLVDDVAADFPEMPIILAHPAFPWQDEALSVAMHKPTVHLDLSGWSPRYFPPQLVRYAKTLLQDKVLFGSDFPFITPDRWMADFDTLEVPEPARTKILKDNAARLLG